MEQFSPRIPLSPRVPRASARQEAACLAALPGLAGLEHGYGQQPPAQQSASQPQSPQASQRQHSQGVGSQHAPQSQHSVSHDLKSLGAPLQPIMVRENANNPSRTRSAARFFMGVPFFQNCRVISAHEPTSCTIGLLDPVTGGYIPQDLPKLRFPSSKTGLRGQRTEPAN